MPVVIFEPPTATEPVRLGESAFAIQRPANMGAFQFVVLATLRTAQLMRGCRPRVAGTHKAMVIAQFEIAQGKVMPILGLPEADGDAGSSPIEAAVRLIPSA